MARKGELGTRDRIGLTEEEEAERKKRGTEKRLKRFMNRELLSKHHYIGSK
jgi:hypothetical protein